MNKLKVFYKIYQDRETVQGEKNPTFYIDTMESIQVSMRHWLEDFYNTGSQMPVFEPVLMTEQEFDSLPEFQGF